MKDLDGDYGNFCMKALPENVSDDTKKQKAVYDSLELPTTQGWYTELFTDSMDGLNIRWRLKTYQIPTYGSTYTSSISMYSVDDGEGIQAVWTGKYWRHRAGGLLYRHHW